MKYFCVLTLLTFLLACTPSTNSGRFAPKAEEILALNYQDIIFSLDFKDTMETARFQESVNDFKGTKFELATKIAHDEGDPVVKYDMMEVDTLKKNCVRHFATYDIREGVIKDYETDTLSNDVESKTFIVDRKEYPVFKIVEEDSFHRDCRTLFISPRFGTLLGRGEVGRYEMLQQFSDSTANKLLKQVKKDTAFIFCGLELELYQKGKEADDAVIIPE